MNGFRDSVVHAMVHLYQCPYPFRKVAIALTPLEKFSGHLLRRCGADIVRRTGESDLHGRFSQEVHLFPLRAISGCHIFHVSFFVDNHEEELPLLVLEIDRRKQRQHGDQRIVQDGLSVALSTVYCMPESVCERYDSRYQSMNECMNRIKSALY